LRTPSSSASRKRSFLNQREVEVDTANFSTALRAALRQDPDVILVGEMRDLEDRFPPPCSQPKPATLVFSNPAASGRHRNYANAIMPVFRARAKQIFVLQLSRHAEAVVSSASCVAPTTKAASPPAKFMTHHAYIRGLHH